MELDPELAAVLAQIPPKPPLRTMDLRAYRAAINAGTAAAPRHDVPLADVSDRLIDIDKAQLPVRIYTPLGDGPFPLVLYYHGGGFVIGDLNVADVICRMIAARSEAVVVSVDYRLAPEFPFPIPNDDCWAALNWAVAHAVELGADAARLAVAGDSAGANLSAAMTLRARDRGDPAIAAQLLLYPAPDYPDLSRGSYRDMADAPLMRSDDALYFWELYLPDPDMAAEPDACPIRGALAGLPPAFIGIAGCDPSRDGAIAYADALDAAGVQTTVRDYPGMPHGFYAWLAHSRLAAQAMDEACAWLKATLQGVGEAPSRQASDLL